MGRINLSVCYHWKNIVYTFLLVCVLASWSTIEKCVWWLRKAPFRPVARVAKVCRRLRGYTVVCDSPLEKVVTPDPYHSYSEIILHVDWEVSAQTCRGNRPVTILS